MKPRVAIVDDHTLFSIALGKLLETDCQIVGTYNDVRTFLTEVERLHPDIVIMDVVMPAMSGLQAAHEIRQRVPTTRVIFLTGSEDPAVAAAARAVGASAFLLKRSAGTELQSAIREAMRAHQDVTSVRAGDVAVVRAADVADRGALRQLTVRQREVLQLLASGRSMKEAAAILNVSVRTVAFHKYRMMHQFDIKSSAALIQFAMREGLI